MKSTVRLTGMVAAILGGIVVIATPIANADSADDAFLHALSAQGITWSNGEGLDSPRSGALSPLCWFLNRRQFFRSAGESCS